MDRTRRVAKPVAEEEELPDDPRTSRADQQVPHIQNPQGQIFTEPSPRRQRLALGHAAWQFSQDGTYDASQSLAWAYMIDPQIELDPELAELFEGDLGTAIAAMEIDDNDLLGAMLPGVDKAPSAKDWVVRNLRDQAMQGTNDQLYAVRVQLQSAHDLLQQGQAHDDTMAALTATPGVRSVEGLDIPGIEGLQTERISRDLDVSSILMTEGSEDIVSLGTATAGGAFAENIQGKELRWLNFPDRVVAGVFDSEGTRLATYDVSLDDPIEDNALAALGAIIDAQLEQKNRLIQEGDLPGAQSFAGVLVEFTVDAVIDPIFQNKDKIDAPLNWLLDGVVSWSDPLGVGEDNEAGGRRWRTSNQRKADDFAAIVDQAVLAGINPDDVLVAGLSFAAGADGTYLSESEKYTDWFHSLDPQTQISVASTFDQVPSREDVEADLIHLKDTRHSAAQALDNASMAAFQGFAWWERFLQGNFVSVVDFFKDLGTGLEAFGIGDTFGEADLVNEDGKTGVELFISAFDWDDGAAAYGGDLNASDYFGIADDSAWYGAVNLMASVVGDPFTWTLASGVARAGEMSRLMKSAEGVTEWLRKPSTGRWKSFIEEIGGGTNNEALHALLATTGISDDGLRKLAATGADIDKILFDEMWNKNMVPSLTGGLKFRNSTQWVAKMSALGDTRTGRGLRYMLGEFATDSSIPLNVAGFRPEFGKTLLGRSGVGRWGSDKTQYGKWADEMMQVADPSPEVHKKLLATRAEDTHKRIVEHTQLGNTAGHTEFLSTQQGTIRASGKLRELEGRLAGATEADEIASLTRQIDLMNNGDEALAQATTAVRAAQKATDNKALQSVDDQLAELDDQLARHAPEVGDDGVDTLGEQLNTQRDFLAAQREELAGPLTEAQAARNGVLAELRALGARFSDGIKPRSADWLVRKEAADAWTRTMNTLNREKASIKNLVAQLSLPGNRALKDDLVTRFWEDWGRELFEGVEVAGRRLSVDDLASMSLEQMPWELIKGEKLVKATADLGVDLAAVTGIADPDLAAKVATAFQSGAKGSVRQPTNVMNAVAYHARFNDEWWANIMVPNPVRGRLGRATDLVRTAFAFNVLMNPFTWIRSNLDEPIRVVVQRGLRGRNSEVLPERQPGRFESFLRRSDDPLPGRVVGGAEGAFRRLQATFRGNAGMDDLSNYFARAGSKPYAEFGERIEYVSRTRKAAKGFGDGATYAGSGEFLSSGRNFFGVLSDKPMWQAFGRSRLDGNEAAFMTHWFDDGGRLRAGVKVNKAGVADMEVDDMLRSLDQATDYFVEQISLDAGELVNHEAGEAFRQAFYRQLADGKPIPDSLLRQLDWVPASSSKTSNLVDSAFHWGFGRPAEVHTGHVAKDFYEQHLDILTARHGDKVLTAERVAAEMGIDIELAESALWMGDPYVDDLVANHGMFTPKMLHVEAARGARVHSDHLAYTMGATTLGGKRLAEQFPFLRAQLDFFGFYKRELLAGSSLNPKLSSALRRLTRSTPDTPGLNPLSELPPIAGLPLNLRLAGKMGDFGGALSTIPDDSEDKFRELIDKYTFLPSRFDETMWTELQPGMAPFPNWLLHGLPLPRDGDVKPEGVGEQTGYFLNQVGQAVRGFLDAGVVAFGFNEDVTPFWPPSAWGQTASELAGAILPGAKGVATGLIRGGQALAAVTDMGAANTWMGTPPGFQTQLRANVANGLMLNARQSIGSEDYEAARGDAVKGPAGSVSTWHAGCRWAGSFPLTPITAAG